MTRKFWLIALLSAVLAVAGCDDEKKGNGNSDAGDTDVTADGDTNTTTNGDTNGGVDMDCSATAGDDDDGDGLTNGFEDKNLNCVVDPGETNWMVADTDGDGISDGDEDLNRNGIVDNGEDDPLSDDSDGDGVKDGDESKAVVCTPDLLDQAKLLLNTSAATNTVVALPDDFTAQGFNNEGAAAFSRSSDNIFGYIVSVDPSTTNIAIENGSNLGKVATGADRFNNVAQATFDTWSHPQLAARPAARNILSFTYGAGSFNDTITDRDPAALRDAIINAFTGGSVASGESGTACTEIIAHHLAVLRGSELILAGLLTCADNIDNDDGSGNPSRDEELRSFLFTDFFGATLIAPPQYQPNGYNCEQLDSGTEGGKVDFLWVIDNSNSMEDEQANVAATAEKFLETLATSQVDWRLAVTTTEAYMLDSTLAATEPFAEFRNDAVNGGTWPGGIDELINLETGLRGEGWLAKPADPNDTTALAEISTKFSDYVTRDQDCPNDANVCGWGNERALTTGLFVLDTTASTSVAGHELRSDAKPVVVIVSDEEDNEYKIETDDQPLNGLDTIIGDGAERTALNTRFIDDYNSRDAVIAAIVGDVGTANGGLCEPLNKTTGTGAEYGQAFVDVATGTNGVFGNICNPDLERTIIEIINLGIRAASQYQLSKAPIASTIRVAVDSTRLERSRTNGWDYDAASNSIIFFGDLGLTGNSNIAVAYQMWRRSGG